MQTELRQLTQERQKENYKQTVVSEAFIKANIF